MAKFVIVIKDGQFEIELEGDPGEVVVPEIVSAYSMMQAGHALMKIADRLDDLSEQVARIADAQEE